jgi:uncharacterized RDD family membrane protein YckC
METGSQPPRRPDEPSGPEGPQAPPPPGYAPPAPGPEGPQAPPPPGAPPAGWQQPQAPAFAGAQLASWGSRLGAYAIDFLIIAVPALILLAIFGAGVAATGDDGDGGFAAFVGGLILTIVVIAIVALLYAPLLMMRKGAANGQTWGKQVLNIRVARDNGQPFSFGSAALREIVLKNLAVGIASSIIPIIPWFLNFFWPLWDDENRALHDMAVSTHVVKA